MKPQINSRPLPKDFVCPCCDMRLEEETALQNAGRPRTKGDILVCGGCANILQVGDSNLVKMQQEDIKTLDHTSQSVLKLAVVSVLTALAEADKEGGERRIITPR